MFTNDFKLTSAGEGKSVLTSLGQHISVGVYDKGLLTVLSEETSEYLVRSLKTILPASAKPFLVTALGDILFWDTAEKAVFYVDFYRYLQTEEPLLLEEDLGYFLEYVLTSDEILADMLWSDGLREKVTQHRPLHYGELFVPTNLEEFGEAFNFDELTIQPLSFFFDSIKQSLCTTKKEWRNETCF